MRQLLAIALCLVFATGAAEAKTYYVDATRSNNNGNGLKHKTAKKTIQAAINLAKAGDTILVYPGTYAPIKTNNKKITIKAVKGASKTKIAKPAKEQAIALAKLGKSWKKPYYIATTGTTKLYTSPAYANGKKTVLSGFLLDGKNRDNGGWILIGISGGTAKSCSIQRLGRYDLENPYARGGLVAMNAALKGCRIQENYGLVSDNSVFNRCTIMDNHDDNQPHALENSQLYNCLIAGNKYSGYIKTGSLFASSSVINCTITKNVTYRWDAKQNAHFATQSKFHNCILRNNYRQVKESKWNAEKQMDELVFGAKKVHNVDSGNAYSRTYKNNRDPKFADEKKGNYKLGKGSPCINQGTLTAGQKKKLGSRDLAGAKRIQGKAVDMGCYEH